MKFNLDIGVTRLVRLCLIILPVAVFAFATQGHSDDSAERSSDDIFQTDHFVNDNAEQPGFAPDSANLLADTGTINYADTLEEVEVAGSTTRSTELRLPPEVLFSNIHIDALSAREISRNGDSKVASALQRLSGLALVDEQYIYLQGLGERYLSNTLNGAPIHSPDLVRNVLALDLFPTSVVESLSVSKSYEASRPGAFGVGEIDIHTKAIPEEFFFTLNMDLGGNTDLRDYKSYPNHTVFLGSQPDKEAFLNQSIFSAIEALNGRIDPQGISNATAIALSDAQVINRELATLVNKDFLLRSINPDIDHGFSISGGDRYTLQSGESSLGYFAYISYDRSYRHYDIDHRALRNPDSNFSKVDESNQNTNLAGYLGVGMEFSWNQKITVNYLYLRNTVDKTSIEDVSHSTFAADTMRRRYWLRFNGRDLGVLQLRGSHGPDEGFHLSWNISLARTMSESPNELRLDTRASLDPQTGAISSEWIENKLPDNELAYTALRGHTNSYALSFFLPFSSGRHQVEFGLDGTSLGRISDQMQILLGSRTQSIPVIGGDLLGAFTDEYINDPDNDVELYFRRDTPESYRTNMDHFGLHTVFRFSLAENWRLGAGLRWERYAHDSDTLSPVFLLPTGFSSGYRDGNFFPSLNLLYSSAGNGWSDVFQFHFSYGRTVRRPDVREVSGAVFVHPITSARVSGDEEVIPSNIDNINATVKWLFDSQDSLGLGIFYKSIHDPIESFEAPASDNDTSSQHTQSIANADSASVYGIEIQGRKNIYRESLFFSGNLTWLQSRLKTGDLVFTPTNTTRSLANASDYVANLTLGYADPEGTHSIRLIYSIFGKRLHFAGRNGAPDAFEKPGQWLNINYQFAFEPGFKLQLKIANLLDENVEIERANQVVYRRNIGREFSMSFSWTY